MSCEARWRQLAADSSMEAGVDGGEPSGDGGTVEDHDGAPDVTTGRGATAGGTRRPPPSVTRS